MNPLITALAGGLIYYAASKGKGPQLAAALRAGIRGQGYADLKFRRFALALVGLTLPALWLERSDEQLAWRYVGLLLLMLVIINYRGMDAFVRFALRELRS